MRVCVCVCVSVYIVLCVNTGASVNDNNEVYQYGPNAAIYFVDMRLSPSSGGKIFYRQVNRLLLMAFNLDNIL